MSMVRRTLHQSMRRVLSGELTELVSRSSLVPSPPGQASRRLPKVPAYISPEREVWMRAAEAALRKKPRRGRYLFGAVLCLLVVLDGLAFGRMAGWWEPVEVLPATCIPGVFVPTALRILSYGAPSVAPAEPVATPGLASPSLGANQR